MNPTVGRIVHYTPSDNTEDRYTPKPQAALIIEVAAIEGAVNYVEELRCTVGLWVFTPTGPFYLPAAPFSPIYERGHWTWPPRA